jgi:carboxyl-terminal processing protease
MNSGKIRFIVSILIAGLVGYYIGVTKVKVDWKNYSPHVVVENQEPPASLMHADFSQFWKVLGEVENMYYDKQAIDPQKLLNGAITGMVNSLDDPYTVYLPPKQNTDFKQGLAGQFEGIGAELAMKDKQIIVVAPLDGSPAKQAGIRTGDAILAVDGKVTSGWSVNQAVDKIRGPKGTEVTLTVLHKSDEKPADIKITRDTITVKSITTWTKKIKDIEEIDPKADGLSANGDDKVIYARLSQFGDSAHDEWQSLAISISNQMKSDSSIKGVVFDLRNNPGGYLPDAVYIASEFIKDGAAVMQEDRNKERQAFAVTGKGILTDVPLVVLINKGSASASEIVAGALRDHQRAKLVGDTSFGKGTIQQAEDMGAGAGLHVTIAKWLTPNGTWVHQKGLEPDVKVSLDAKDPSHDTQLEKAIETLLQ